MTFIYLFYLSHQTIWSESKDWSKDWSHPVQENASKHSAHKSRIKTTQSDNTCASVNVNKACVCALVQTECCSHRSIERGQGTRRVRRCTLYLSYSTLALCTVLCTILCTYAVLMLLCCTLIGMFFFDYLGVTATAPWKVMIKSKVERACLGIF